MAEGSSKGGSLPLASAPAYDTSLRPPNRGEAIHAGSSATPSPKGLHPLNPPVAGCPRLQKCARLTHMDSAFGL